MKQPKKQTKAQLLTEVARVRGEIFKVIVALEKKYGQRAVGGAFAKHTMIRRERRYLERVQAETNEKIAKLQRQSGIAQ